MGQQVISCWGPVLDLPYRGGSVGATVGFWRGLDLLFGLITMDETLLVLSLRYIRYAVTTIWAFYGAPWIFMRLKLAEEQRLK